MRPYIRIAIFQAIVGVCYSQYGMNMATFEIVNKQNDLDVATRLACMRYGYGFEFAGSALNISGQCSSLSKEELQSFAGAGEIYRKQSETVIYDPPNLLIRPSPSTNATNKLLIDIPTYCRNNCMIYAEVESPPRFSEAIFQFILVEVDNVSLIHEPQYTWPFYLSMMDKHNLSQMAYIPSGTTAFGNVVWLHGWETPTSRIIAITLTLSDTNFKVKFSSGEGFMEEEYPNAVELTNCNSLLIKAYTHLQFGLKKLSFTPGAG